MFGPQGAAPRGRSTSFCSHDTLIKRVCCISRRSMGSSDTCLRVRRTAHCPVGIRISLASSFGTPTFMQPRHTVLKGSQLTFESPMSHPRIHLHAAQLELHPRRQPQFKYPFHPTFPHLENDQYLGSRWRCFQHSNGCRYQSTAVHALVAACIGGQVSSL